MQIFEVVRENAVDAVLPAQCGNLGIEHQVAVRIHLTGSRKEPMSALWPTWHRCSASVKWSWCKAVPA